MSRKLIPSVLIRAGLKSLRPKAFWKLPNPTNSRCQTGMAKVDASTFWKAIVHPHRGMYLKIMSQIKNGSDISIRYR